MSRLKFEDSLSRLESLVNTLEKGDLPLEDSLKLFEEGVRLSKNCLKILNEAEKKVAFLMNEKEAPLEDLSYIRSAGDIPTEDITESDEDEESLSSPPQGEAPLPSSPQGETRSLSSPPIQGEAPLSSPPLQGEARSLLSPPLQGEG